MEREKKDKEEIEKETKKQRRDKEKNGKRERNRFSLAWLDDKTRVGREQMSDQLSQQNREDQQEEQHSDRSVFVRWLSFEHDRGSCR